MQNSDYYQVLGLEGQATQDEIKQAYRKLAFQCHPDRNVGDPSANEKMKQLNEAYATLSSPAKRREYDFLRERYGAAASDRFRQAHSGEDIFRGTDIEQVLQEFARAFGFRSADEIFREAYGAGARSYEFHGAHASGRVFIFQGGPRPGPGDAGPVPAIPALPFPGFIGKLIKFIIEKATGIELPERGKDCEGTLKVKSTLAEKGGEIKYRQRRAGIPRDLMVKVPPAVKSGQRIRLKGMGGPGRGGAPAGDLYLRVKVARPWWRRLASPGGPGPA